MFLSLQKISDSEKRAINDTVRVANEVSEQTRLNLVGVTTGLHDVAHIRQAYEAALAFVEQQTTGEKLEEKFDVILCRCGWPPLLDFTLRDIQPIIAAYDSTGFNQFRKDFETALIECFGSDVLTDKITSWSNKGLRAERLSILEKAVKAHCAGDYFLSIPVILAQMEGVIAEGMGHLGRMKGADMSKYIETLAHGYAVKPFYSSVKDYVTSTLFVEFKWGNHLTSSLSRHAILHGADTDYGTEVNSLKALLLFDFIVFSLCA